MDQNAERIWNLVSEKTGTFRRLADTVWSNPEVNYEEFASCEEHARALSAEGFTVTRQVAGLPTAVMGEAGEGGVVIAFLGEYDALPHLSQEAGVASHAPIKPYGHGHGCGHHLLGSGAMQAATAVKNYLRQENIPGRVRYYGCPAEEGGSGKG
ncbi:M20/M25/M40 family metallo-hydrolase, partial [Mesorhizobium sp. M7A.F.Ca.ET.027.03.2.1]